MIAPTRRISYHGLSRPQSRKNTQELTHIADPLERLAPVEPEDSWVVRNCRGLADIFFNPLNLLLLFVPLGVWSHHVRMSSAIVFLSNFLAIVPVASVLCAATEILALRSGQLIGGLLNATFGNAVEMIMCIQAVRSNLVRVVQANILGSILSNLLLVLGMAMTTAGAARQQASYNPAVAAANMSCLILASLSVALPTVYRNVQGASDEDILMLSRICALFLVVSYFLLLTFQLLTHTHLFVDEGIDDEEPSEMTPGVAVFLLAVSTLVVVVCSEYLVESIQDVSENFGLPNAFIGVILLPIVGNAAQHSTAIVCAYKGLMELALGVAVGSSTQIALFVVPAAVLFGWVYGTPMTLSFRNFDFTCVILTVFLTSQVLQHGQANWLHGAMLMTTYFLIAIICWFVPE